MNFNKIKVESQKCSLCHSKNTKSNAEFRDGQYKIVTECLNANCISNKLNRVEIKNLF